RKASRRARGLLIVTIVTWIAAACVFAAAIFVRTRAHASSAAQTPATPAAPTTPPPPALTTAPVASLAVASATSAPPPPAPTVTSQPSARPAAAGDRGRIVFPAWAKEHRVYVDRH